MKEKQQQKIDLFLFCYVFINI